MQGALRRHDEILREAVTRHGGVVVKTTGDGVHAVAPSAADGLRAAIAAQHALLAEPWGPVGPLRVRMGLHAGAAWSRDGDYYGPVVNRAARVMSVAHGGQILASQTVAELVRDARIHDVELVDLGPHRLRDLAQAETLFQVSTPALPGAFPPLRSVDSFSGNLPSQLTSFLGRESDLEQLAQLSSTQRLVTLVGAGGVGKTRLALQHAAATMPQNPDGTWLCELALVGEPSAVAQMVVATLGAGTSNQPSPEDAIVELLRSKRTLIVLDNCEHVIDAAAALAQRLLRDCPQLRIVATSREALGIEGEQQWPVAPLPLPVSRGSGILAGPAVELFVERARAARPDFVMTEDNSGSILEICRRLDGLPLAIELAAARTAALGPAQIAQMLDERFRLLTRARRLPDDRHQTLRATIDWSHASLSPAERTVFERLGVFTGSFDSAAAAAVVADETLDVGQVLDAITGLVSKSMVTAELANDESMRYLLLETLREYARDHLDHAGDLTAWSRRHAQCYVKRAGLIGTVMMGPEEIEWRARLKVELGNLRAAVAWSLASSDEEDSELASEIIAPLAHQSVMDPSMGISDWAVEALERGCAMSPAGRFGVQSSACYHALRAGDYQRAGALAAAAIDGGALAVARFPHMPYVTRATEAALQGRADDCIAVFDEGARMLTEVGAPLYDQAILAGARGVTEAAFGLSTARPCAEAALTLAREVGNPSCLVGALFALAISVRQEDPERALAAFDEGIAIAQAGSNGSFLGHALAVSAQLRAERGDERAALGRIQECAEHFTMNPDRPSLVTALSLGVPTLAATGHDRLAAVIGGAVTGPFAPLSQLPTDQYRRLADALQEVGNRLGDPEFQAEVGRGAAMSLDELLELVRMDLRSSLDVR